MKNKTINKIEDMKNCFKYKIRKGTKGKLKTLDKAEVAIYQLSLDILLLRDFLKEHLIDYKNEAFASLEKGLDELYASLAVHRYDCFRYENPTYSEDRVDEY